MPRTRPRGSRSPAPSALAFFTAVIAACGGDNAETEPDPYDPTPRIRAILENSSAPVLPVPGADTVHLTDQLQAFYANRGYRSAWTDREGFIPQGDSLFRVLSEARSRGLDPARYQVDAVRALVARAIRESREEVPVGDVLASIDMVLTEALLRYATDMERGSVDADSLGIPWLIPRGDSADAASLDRLVEHPSPMAALDSLQPAVPFYHQLRGALERYWTVVEAGGWPTVSEGDRLEEGTRDPRVVEVRRRLVAERDPVEQPLVADAPEPAHFDARLAQAITHFQERHGLEPDGAIGPATLQEMNVAAEDRLLAMMINLDRWRWLPRELGPRYILVNVAGFEMAVMEGDEAVLRMDVVVGREGRNTPFFQDTLEYVVVNPFWNVPPSIFRQDILPAMQRDPGYLARNGYEVVKRSGGQVEAVRQRPGPDNSLGAVKFLFPNSMDIYLHDTPARHLFERTRRAFSSGCIRVEKPRELAEYLFRTSTSRPPGAYDELRATGREQWVELEEKLPIYILYFTAWADAEGSVRFYPDVYDRDDAINELARATLGPIPRPTSPVDPRVASRETPDHPPGNR